MVEILIHSTIGFLVLLASNGALFYAAHLLVRRVFSEAPGATRWAALGIAVATLIIVLTQTLSAVSFYNRFSVTLGSLLLAGVGHWLWGRHRNIRIEIEPVKTWLGAVIDSRGAILFCVATILVLLALSRGLIWPPLSWDSLTYHLFFAARYVQLGYLAGFTGPHAMDHYAHFPINGEIMAAWLLLPFHSDLIVGLLNFPFLALGAVAVYGLCRELGVKWDDASMAACLVCLSPFLFAYLTTQDVDIQVFAVLMCGALFVIRYWLHKRSSDAWFGFVAIGIAVGTKYSAVVLGILLFATLAIFVFLHNKQQKTDAAALITVLCALLLMGIVGGQRYIKNWWEKDNPFYPVEVKLAGKEIFTGSPYTSMIADERGKGTRREDLVQFIQLFNYFPTWRLPTSAGPKFLPLFVLAAIALVGCKHGNRSQWLVAAYGAVGMIAFYFPEDGFPALARRIWPGASARFLAPSFAFLTVAAMPAVSSLRRQFSALPGILASFVLWDAIVTNSNVSANFPLAIGIGAAMLVSAGIVVPRSTWLAKMPQKIKLISLLLISFFLVSFLQVVRDRNRWYHYENSTDVHWIPRNLIEGWNYCDRQGKPLRIAFTAGWEYLGQNWFFYPLLGSRLQNAVAYVPVSRNDDLRPLNPDRQGQTNKPTFSVWLGNLQREKINTIFVQKPWPLEDQWIAENPDKFAVLLIGDSFKIYHLL